MGNYTSTRFANISGNLDAIAAELLRNDELLKWVGYLNDEPDKMSVVPPPSRIIGNHILLTRVDNEIIKEEKVMVFISPAGGSDIRNTVLTNTVFQVDIIMPTGKGYIYPTRTDRFSKIASLIAESVDGRTVTGVGDVEVGAGFNAYKVNDRYSGMMFRITVKNCKLGDLRNG